MFKFPIISITFILLIGVLPISSFAQTDNLHRQSSTYEWPKEPEVRKKLEQWQDLKFGMIIHWGIYAVPGMIESWGICSEDWIGRDSTVNYEAYKQWYWDLSKKFNPVNFNPEQWAQAADDAGMRYLVFTTKHHDGFCMFDTKETDYKITAGPFANNPRANVTKYIFEAFRKKNFMIGAYFSKPDWHNQDYWWPTYATADRNNNYDIRKYPWRWNRFKQYTHNQMSELLHDYGKVDILWLDGGWVRPLHTVNEEVRSWGATIPEWSQDIDMPRIAEMGRKAQPGLLIVDRTVHGPYENYQTPEQNIPATKLDYPWESCITLGHSWGYNFNEKYKSNSRVIHSLIEIVAKGGSLLLGVGPNPDGTIDQEVITRLAVIGKWVKNNGKAMYGTRTTEHYRDGETFFTKNKDNSINALVRIPEGADVPATIEWNGNVPKKGTKMVLAYPAKSVKWKAEGNKVKVTIPESLRKQLGQTPAVALTYTIQ